jgi:hypothetical protein
MIPLTAILVSPRRTLRFEDVETRQRIVTASHKDGDLQSDDTARLPASCSGVKRDRLVSGHTRLMSRQETLG